MVAKASLVFLLIAGAIHAQPAVSTRAGLIYKVAGAVFLDGELLDEETGRFPEMNVGSVLRSGDGRATMLLNPGASLKMDPHSTVRMIHTALGDTRIELMEGKFQLRCRKVFGDNVVAVAFGDVTVTIRNKGRFEFDVANSMIEVVRGKAVITTQGNSAVLRQGETAELDPGASKPEFDRRLGTSLVIQSDDT